MNIPINVLTPLKEPLYEVLEKLKKQYEITAIITNNGNIMLTKKIPKNEY